MKYIKTYEGTRYNGPKPPFNTELRNKFINSKNETHTTFDLDKLKKDCKNNDINFLSLLKEILIGRQIAFKCTWCYTEKMEDNVDNLRHPNHSVIGICKDATHENEDYNESDIVVKIDDDEKWHTLFIGYVKQMIKQKVRVYNYTEGKLMRHINMIKNMNKYNL